MHASPSDAIKKYTEDTAGRDIVCDSHAHPCSFSDTNGSGVADPDDAIRDNGYATWKPRLLRAA